MNKNNKKHVIEEKPQNKGGLYKTTYLLQGLQGILGLWIVFLGIIKATEDYWHGVTISILGIVMLWNGLVCLLLLCEKGE